MLLRSIGVLMLLLFASLPASCRQLDNQNVLDQFPKKYFPKVINKITGLENQLPQKTGKYLQRLIKQENKLKKLLAKKDSAAPNQLFGNINDEYEKLKTRIAASSINKAGHEDIIESERTIINNSYLLFKQNH